MSHLPEENSRKIAHFSKSVFLWKNSGYLRSQAGQHKFFRKNWEFPLTELIRALHVRCWLTVACCTFAAPNATWGQTQGSQDIHILIEQLNVVRTVQADTVNQILQVSRKDPRARQYVVQKLPELIRRPESDVWLDAIRIAGKLKAKEAIPALQEALSRPPMPAEPYLTFAGIERLDNDIVGKALSQIGDPAIPSVRSLLVSKDALARSRAVLILRNIGSPAGRKALQGHLPRETNQEVRKLIQDSLRS